ncbi:MAG: replication and repair protein RecF [Actinomycetota bacterium]|nr:replication and repair protein RecF [Actinomycetota bacterium]
MRVEKIALEDFRNYRSGSLALPEGLVLVVGANAQGKTNLLEAVHMLSGLGSPRGDAQALVREGAERALIHANVTRGRRNLEIDMEIKPGRGARVLVNKTPVQRSKALAEVIVTVFFGPDELSLVKGSPDGRRRFLDELTVKLRPARDALRREFERVLRQRNALLKTLRGASPAQARDQIGVWDDALTRAGAALAAARLESLAALIPYARKRYEEVAGGGRLELEYESSWLSKARAEGAEIFDLGVDRLEAAISDRIDELRHAELERGLTLVGPQRDDVSVLLASRSSETSSLMDARTFASQGDQRTSALALKLAEHDLLTDALGDQPILLLDDVFSELDADRRAWLCNAVRSMGQTIVSSAEPLGLDALKPEVIVEITAGKAALRA